jgi:hypothetical protein
MSKQQRETVDQMLRQGSLDPPPGRGSCGRYVLVTRWR